MTAIVKTAPIAEQPEDEKELQAELKLLVDRITGSDTKLILPSLEMLKYLIRTSTASMTSVPKPIKLLVPYYNTLKETHKKLTAIKLKQNLSDVISVLAIGSEGEKDCLKYCITGTMKNIGDWGHEYIRHLETEIVQQWLRCDKSSKILMPLVEDITEFNCNHHAEIQACDFLMEIDELQLLNKHIKTENFTRICLYLASCAKYVEDTEKVKILNLSCDQYYNFGQYTKALIIALQINDLDMINRLFNECEDKATLYQLAFICARQLYPVEVDPDKPEAEKLNNILTNNHLCAYFHTLTRELDILEPKAPEDVYKTWLEPTTPRMSLLAENMDSARQNLASSFVNGFVNAGFGTDKLLSTDNGNKWIYRNKDHAMISATASLGLLYLWDVDGGLSPIDKYLYTTEDFIKSGALLALGIVNCRVRNECDPALALLGDYVNNTNSAIQIGAIWGIGLAYAGTARQDVVDILLPVLQTVTDVEVLAVTSLACGLITLGRNCSEVASAILSKMIDENGTDTLKSHHMRLFGLGLSLCYFGEKEAIDVTLSAMEVFDEPFKSMMQAMLKMCAYAGTGDVMIIQELLRIVEENVDQDEVKKAERGGRRSGLKKPEWDYNISKAISTLAVAAISMGEEIGVDMVQRIFGNVGRYSESTTRRTVPLAMALTSVSYPDLSVMDVLTKYSHDPDDDVSCNAIFSLGIIGAGTNNARLASCLRSLAVYHNKNPSQLFMVRLAQGLVHMGKGTLTLNPFHTDRQLLDPVAMAGLLINLVSFIEPHAIILGRSHYLLYSLVPAMQPRWLLTVDENLESVSISVRVGQAVDVVAKAGSPKTIVGIRTHATPVLLDVKERAELATDEYEALSNTLDGIWVLKKKPE